MKATCPNGCEGNKFYATAHVAQTWVVDGRGNWLSTASTDDITHGPDAEDSWTCVKCGAEAEVMR